MKRKLQQIAITILLCAFSFSVNAQVVSITGSSPDSIYLYDDFNIPGITLTDNGNGISGKGWSNRWSYLAVPSTPINVVDSSLIYPSASNAIGSGGYIEENSSGGNTFERSFANAYEMYETTFYISFLAQKDSSGSFSIEGYGSNGYTLSKSNCGCRIGASGMVELRGGTSWQTDSITGVFANDTTYLVVIAKEHEINKIALFEMGDSIPSDTSTVNWVITHLDTSIVAIDKFRIAFSSESVKFDELRLGSTWQSVTQGSTWLSSLAAPTSLSLSPDTLNVDLSASSTLSWTDNSGNETGFKVYQNGVEIASVAANVTSYEVSNVIDDSEFYFDIAAYNNMGVSSKSNIEILTILNSSNVYLEQPAHGSTLYQTIPYFSWSHESQTGFTGYYEIMIDNDSNFTSPVDIDTVPSFINYYSPDFELTANMDYYWKVRFVDENYLSADGWSLEYTFSIDTAQIIVDVLSGEDWDDIRTKWNSVLTASDTTDGAVELRFPVDGVINVQQDPNSDEEERSNGFFLWNNGHDNVIVNGRGTKIIIEATHGEWLCGFMEVSNSSGMQVKDLIIDYHPNSLMQIGGVVKNFDKTAGTFDVIIDPSVYQTYDVLKIYNEGYFLTKEEKQKIGLKGIRFHMDETWEQARVNDSTFSFTCGTSEYGRYKEDLEDGDYFVLSERAGDIMFLSSNVSNFVVNNLTTYACRGRFFAISERSNNTRCLNNSYLVSQGRIMGSASGGVGVDRGDNMWYENNHYEYSRDDMFHSGSNAGAGMVFRRNYLVGAYRNSIWVQGDRTWVAGNTVEYSATSGIHIGYAPSNPGTMPNVCLVEDNTISHSGWYGIRTDTDTSNPDYKTGSIYNENIVIRNNHIIDNIRDEAMQLEYMKNSVVENNLITSTINYWSYYSEPFYQMGIHINNSVNVSGDGNVVNDSRIIPVKYLDKDSVNTNVTVTVNSVEVTAPTDTLWVYDDFDIIGDTLTDNGNGTSGVGWFDKWSYITGSTVEMAVNDSSSLSYPSASSALVKGGHIYKELAGATIIERSLANTYELHNTDQFLSFLAKKDASGSFSLEGYGGTYMRYGLRVGASGTVEARASAKWGTASSAGIFENNKTYLIVLAKDHDINKIALFEEGDSIPSDTANVNWVVTNTGATGVDLDKLQFVISDEHVKIDELRFGNTWASVTQGSKRVVGVTPTEGSTNIAIDSTIAITFTETMNHTSVQNAITITPDIYNKSYDWTNNTLKISGDDMDLSTNYQIAIDTTAKTIGDVSLITGYRFGFTTVGETISPTVVSVTPTNGSTDIAVNSDVVITFSEAMNRSSVESSISVLPTVSNLVYSWDNEAEVVSLSADNFENSTTYTVTISTGAADASDNNIAAIYTFSFTTDENTIWVYDDFDITGDTLTDNGNGNSGSGWSGSWSYVTGSTVEMFVNDSVSLNFPSASNATTTGGHIYKSLSGETIIERSLEDTYELHNTDQFLSLLAEKDASGSFSLEGYGGTYMRYGFRVGASGTVEARASANWGTASSAGIFENNKTYLIVLAKDHDVNKIALFEEGDSIPSDTANVNWVVINTGATGVDLDKLQFVISDEHVKIDELRFGNTWASVTQGSTAGGTKSGSSNTSIDINPNGTSNDIIPDINLYPNPASGRFYITISDEELETVNMQMIDLSGKTVLSRMINMQQSVNEVDISSFKKGLYIVRLFNNDFNYVSKLIVK
jgi:hypothetical protein